MYSNSNNHYTSHNSSKSYLYPHNFESYESSAVLPDKPPPTKTVSQAKSFYNPSSISDQYDMVKYHQTTTVSQHSYDRFNTLATVTDSITNDQPGENRWLSKCSGDQMGSKVENILSIETPLHIDEKRSSKTLHALPAAYMDMNKSRSHQRTLSSPHDLKESYIKDSSHVNRDLKSSALYGDKRERTGYKERKRAAGRRRGMSPIDQPSSHLHDTLNNERSLEEKGWEDRLYMTEQLHINKLFSPNYDEKRLGRTNNDHYSLDKSHHQWQSKDERSDKIYIKDSSIRNDSNRRLAKSSTEQTMVSPKGFESRRRKMDNSHYRDVLDSTDYARMVDSKDYGRPADSGEYRSYPDRRLYRENPLSKTHFGKSRVQTLEDEVKERDNRILQIKKFHDQLYQNYVEARGELEKSLEEKEGLIGSLKSYANENEYLKRRLSETQERDSMLNKENQELKRDQVQRDEVINMLEVQIGKFKAEIATWTKRHADQADSFNGKVRRLEKDKRELLSRRGKRERSIGGHVNPYELANVEERAKLIRSLEEKKGQLKDLKEQNNELIHEVERLNRRQQRENLEKQYSSERQTAVSAKGETLKILEETFNQNRDSRNQDLSVDLKRCRSEIDMLRTENELLKLEVQERPTLRADESLERSGEDIDKREKGRKSKGSSEVGTLGRVLREIMNEVGVDSINDVAARVRELQEGNKTNEKFMSGILDLVYKCSPNGFFEARPTPKQAWKWLKRLMMEYMSMKKRKGNENENNNVEKEIVDSLLDCLRLKDSSEVVGRVRFMAAENSKMRRVVDNMKAKGLENSFGLGDLEKPLEKSGKSYSSYGNLHSTAKFEDPRKI